MKIKYKQSDSPSLNKLHYKLNIYNILNKLDLFDEKNFRDRS